MIVFKTMSQVNNYLKRHKGHYNNEGCGCCWSQSSYSFDKKKNRLIYSSFGETQGSSYYDVKVIGKIRRKE